MSFERAIKFVLKWEGGSKYTNDPTDPGGETKYGISKRAHPDLDIFNLTLEQAKEIYKEDYWDAAGCEGLPEAVGVAVMDAAVNTGTSRAKTWLESSKGDLEAFQHLRYRHYIDLVNRKPVMVKYIKGWLNRLNDLNKYIGINMTFSKGE